MAARRFSQPFKLFIMDLVAAESSGGILSVKLVVTDNGGGCSCLIVRFVAGIRRYGGIVVAADVCNCGGGGGGGGSNVDLLC